MERWFETAKEAIEYVLSDYWVEPTHVANEQEAWKFNIEVHSLDWSESGMVHFARRKRAPGRPKLDASDPTERVTVTLPASIAAKASDLGNGNISAGVRLAIEAA